jgi:hypothetical protein
LEVYGSLTLGTGMVFNFAGNVSFEATVPGKTITSSGVPISSSLTFNGIGGSWTLQDALTVLNTLYLNNGILSTNNQIVNATAFYSYTSSARTLNLGASVFNLSGSYQMWYILNPSSLTLNAGASTINITSNDNQQLFVGGGLNYNNISFVGKGQIYDNNIINDVSFGGDAEIRGNNTFHNVTFGGAAFLYSASVYNDVTIAKQAEIFGNNTFNNLSFSPGYTYTLEADQTQTILGSLTVNGNCGALIGIVKSSSIGNQATISKASGNVVVSYVTLKDINATGGAAFTANNAIDLGNNTGWTINTLPSKSLYWVGNGGNWDDGNHWSLTSGGSPSGCSPTPVDNVFFDANSFSTAGQSVTINVPTAYCNNMNWTGAANNPSIEGTYTSVFKIYGSLTLAAGMAFNFAGDILFEATTTGKTITTAGVPVNTTLRFDGIGGGWTLQDNLSTSLIFLNSGSLSTNSKTVTAYAFYSFSNFTKALTLGSSVVNLTGSFQIWNIDNPATMTLDASTSTIRSTYAVGSQQLFEGGGFTYNDIVFDAGGQIYDDNTIHDVSFGGEGQIRGNNTFHDVTFNDNALLYAPSTYNNVTMAKNGEILYFSNTFNNLSFSPGYTYTLEAGQTQTVGNLCAVGTGALPIRIQSSSVGSPATISKTSGTLCWDYVRISDLNATGGAIFDAGLAPSHTEDLGGNSGFLFTGACTPASCTPCNPPVVTTQPVNSTICAGNNSSFTVAATGDGLTYQWQVNTGSGYSNLSNSAPYTGVTTNSIQITAATNGLNGYQYRCIVNGTCTPSATSNGASLTVNPVPSVTVNSATICVGQTTTLTAAGATTYSWNTGATTSTISVSSGATTSYTVTGTSNGCSANAVATVTVNTLPAVNVNSVTILTGQNAILTATGASSYVWSTGATTNSITVSPAATTSYTVTGTTSGCSNSAVATVTVNAQSVTYYRSRQSGNWNSVNTWQTSTDNATWSNATQVPNYNTVSTIIIQSGHTVTISSTVTFDEVVVNGTLVYPNTGGATLTINNGTGTDLIINGIFEDSRNTAITWSTNATWSMGSNGSLVRTTNTSSANWNSNYDGGISAIPATANWVLRKTGGTNPSLTNTAGMFYPNLIIENNNGGSTWTTAAASSFTGTSVPPVIKGNLNIGGNGTGNVSFLNNNTNSSPVLINGSLTVKAGSTLRSQGTGFEVQGNLVLNGSINYGTSNATFVLSGNTNQTISGTGTIAFRNIQLNKATTAATVVLSNPATLSGTATFTSGYLTTTATNVLTFSNGATVSGTNNNSFVSGPVRKAGNSAFTFPIGKTGNYQPVAISAPTNAAATYVAEYFHQDAAVGSNKDATIDFISNCEYWTLNNIGIAYPVKVTLGWNDQSCLIATGENSMRLTRWNGTKWIDLGNSSNALHKVTSISSVTSFGTFTLAQTNSDIVGSEVTITPEGLFDKVFDKEGRKYSLNNLVAGETNSNGAKSISLCTPGYFNVFFEDGSGMEGNSAIEIARRNVICRVLTDISSFIPAPAGSPLALGTTRVNFWVRDIAAVSSSTSILGTASAFYAIPSTANLPTPGGIAENEVFKTIVSGIDSYTNVASPLIIANNPPGVAAFYHGLMAFNFNNINWETNLTATSTSAYDLYTVALHEITHALGIASIIDYTGLSKFGTSFPYYSSYDNFLTNVSGTHLIVPDNSTCASYNFDFNSSLNTSILTPGCTSIPPVNNSGSVNHTVCANALYYTGSVTLPVYTSSCFEVGSSLAHFEDECYPTSTPGNDNYFTMSNATGMGVYKRFLKPEERRVLCDLGYRVNSTYGGSSVYNSFYNYGTTTCPGKDVVGINDGLTGSTFQFVSTVGTTFPINFNTILSNDVEIGTSFTHPDAFECLEIVSGTGSLSATSGTSTTIINFTPPATSGIVLLRYIPVAHSGQRGNITYIYIYNNDNFSCTPNACNLIPNGDFETHPGGIPNATGQINKTCGWNNAISSGTCDYYHNQGNAIVDVPCNTNGAENDNLGLLAYAGFASQGLMGYTNEVIYTKLSSPLAPNTAYTLTLDASLAEKYSTNGFPLGVCFSQNYIPVSGSLIASSPSNMFLPAPAITNWNGWTPVTINFTTGNTPGIDCGQDFIIIGNIHTGSTQIAPLIPLTPAPTGNLGCTYTVPSASSLSYLYIDNVVLQPAALAATFTPPAIVCLNQTLALNNFVSTGGGSFTGAGVSGSTFIASTAGAGAHTLIYTYTNNLGCVMHTSATITVANSNINFGILPVNPTTCAPGQSITLTASGATSYVWQPGSFTGNTISVSPLTTTTYTVTATNSSGCTDTKTVTVTVTAPCNAGLTINYYVPCSGTTTSAVFAVGNNGLVANKNISISGVLTVNNNIAFSNCNFVMAPGARIVVNPNIELSIISNTHIFSCGNMWDGIYLNGNNSKLTVLTNAFIEDAINTIVVPANGGTYTIQDAIFNRNLTVIKVTGKTNPGTIRHSIITSRLNLYSTGATVTNREGNLTNYTKTSLKAPYSDRTGLYGVNATDVGNIYIGIDGGAGRTNTFDAIMCGVSLIRTNAIIYNNIFQYLLLGSNFACQIGTTCLFEPGYGIAASGSTTAPYSITIGNSNGSYRANSFFNTHLAINVNNYKTISVVNNTINNTSTGSTNLSATGYGAQGIYVRPALNNNTIDVISNSVTNCAVGIWVSRTGNGRNSQWVFIDHNTVKANSTGYCNSGITVSDIGNTVNTTPTDKIKVQYNTIQQAYTCVTATNVKNSLVIRENPILEVRNNGSTAGNGVRLQNCQNVKIHNNSNITLNPGSICYKKHQYYL